MGTTLTYGQLDQLSARFARWLQDEGFNKGDRLAIILPNILQYPVILAGALRAGLTIVNINPLLTPSELEYQLVDSGSGIVVILENFAHKLEPIIGRTAVRRTCVTALGDFLAFRRRMLVNFAIKHLRKQVPAWSISSTISLRAVLRAPGARPAVVAVGLDDVAFLQYTGGTTGVPKGAALTHGNVGANVVQSMAWVASALARPEMLVTAIPLYHIFALECSLFFMRLGWSNLLIVNPRDLQSFVAEISRYPIALMTGVNTLFKGLLNTPEFSRVDFRHLKMTLGGGMAVEPAIADRWREVTGNVVTQAWGLTECSPAVCINPPGAEFNGSVGLPIPSTEVSVRDEEGTEVKDGELGELCVRGPQVMRSYWNRPAETAATFFPDRWLRTGDIGRLDSDGFVFIEDRKKDLINVSGFKVYPSEVEAVAVTHPQIAEAAAVGCYDDHSGEIVVLYVVPKAAALDPKDVIDHCRHALAPYKVPRQVIIRAELPKSNIGKVLRRCLREAREAPRARGGQRN